MISIIVPVYNGEKYLDACIRSIIHQTSEAWELLLVNDGSTDMSERICQKYLSDTRIKYLSKKNDGVQSARWYGVCEARYPNILFLDADDVLLPSAIDVLNKSISAELDIITIEIQHFVEEDSIQTEQTEQGSPFLWKEDKYAVLKAILKGDILSRITGSLYKKQLLLDAKEIFDNGLRIGEDMMANLEMVFLLSPRIGSLQGKYYCYRTNEQSVMHLYNEQRNDAVYNSIIYLEDWLQRNRLNGILQKEAAFRILLLWSSYVFHPDRKYYGNRLLRNRMRRYYRSAFPFLYPYLKFYLFVDFFLANRPLINKLKKICLRTV